MKDIDVASLIRENVKQLKPYRSARDDFKGQKLGKVFLDANENPFDNGINRYPDSQQQSIKQHLSKYHNVSTECILLGNGSDEVLDLLMRVFCEPKKDSIITLPPTYSMYGVLANTNDIFNKKIYLTKEFQPDVEAILENSKGAKMLFLCSPNNPTGNNFDGRDIERIINGFHGIVVIDEAYIEFSSNPSWLNRLESYPHLVITRTLSKAHGMAGARLGICYASPYIISMISRIKPPYNINTYTQNHVLKHLKEYRISPHVEKILEQRDMLLNALKTVAFVRKIYPTDANFILVEVDDARKRYKELLSLGIVVRDRSKEPLCENTLRLTIGTPKENQILIKMLKILDS